MSEFITGPKMIALNAEARSQREAELQARIRELEAQLDRQYQETVEQIAKAGAAQILTKAANARIAKAKKLLEITQAALAETDAPVIKFGIKDALEALEGKK